MITVIVRKAGFAVEYVCFLPPMRVILSAPSGRRFNHTEAPVGGWEEGIHLKLEDAAMIVHTRY